MVILGEGDMVYNMASPSACPGRHLIHLSFFVESSSPAFKMSFALATVMLLAVASVTAAPASPITLESRQLRAFEAAQVAPWDAGAVNLYPIHSSCNITQKRLIQAGLNDTMMLASHAMAHIDRWGTNSEIYRKYFGDRPTFEAVGAYDIIVNGDKSGVLFRCDDPDDNCKLPGTFIHGDAERSILTRNRMGWPLARRECHW